MFAMKEYPADVLPLYSQGYSLARYLIEQAVENIHQFVGEGLATSDWPLALSSTMELMISANYKPFGWNG